MPLPFTKYADIKDQYCICYFGPCDEYIVQLLYLRSFIETKFPGIEIHIGCRDSLSYLSANHKRIVPKSQIKDKKRNYAHIRELKCNMEDHPVYKLLEESGLEHIQVAKDVDAHHTHRCVICPRGVLPTKSLTSTQIKMIESRYRTKGFSEIYVSDDIQGAGVVAGVESPGLFRAACQGIRTALVPTGLGIKLYKMIARKGEIIDIPV